MVNYETRFKHHLFLKMKIQFLSIGRDKFKESVTSEYGEQLTGYNQHQGFADALRAIGFNPSQAKVDIWIRENNRLYEYIAVYIAVYVDDLLIAVKEIVQTQLKGVGPLTYHFGYDYFRDHDGTLCFGPWKYITKMMDQFKNMYGCKPKRCTSPLEKGDHPDIDTLKNFH
jgi:hypothetical protein